MHIFIVVQLFVNGIAAVMSVSDVENLLQAAVRRLWGLDNYFCAFLAIGF